MTTTPQVSVVMPTYDQARFLPRAVATLQAQTLTAWELIIVDDGSPDDTPSVVAPLLIDTRICYERSQVNRGLGAALNTGLSLAQAPLIAYLPSDDQWFPTHLQTLVATLTEQPEAVLAYSGVRHHYNKFASGQIDNTALQLVQVCHRRTDERWVEREELVTDDVGRMFWHKLGDYSAFAGTDDVTCEWVDHPAQMHKTILEPLGGLNPFRARYQPPHPLRFHTSVGNRIDEVAQYRQFREQRYTPAADGLKILLVGELAYNAERVLALAERGHTLYGLWTPEPYWFNMVGPVPFGHVEDLPRNDWQNAIKRIQPDVIYALLNWQTVKFCHYVMQNNPGVPFVWHFKEGPFICLEKGLWNELAALYEGADGQIYCAPEERDWFNLALPGVLDRAPHLVLDGDLPKADWFTQSRPARLSEQDGQFHTVVPGRPIGLHPWTVGELAAQGIHLHFYGDFTQGIWKSWIEKANKVANGLLHLHPNVDQEQWTTEFGQYDAGWLHLFESQNAGDLRRANWDDLNYPARIGTLAMAGLPMLQRDNAGAAVAMQSLVRDRDLGLFFSDMAELRSQLADAPRMARIRDNVWQQRHDFTFDSHADTLVHFFRQVIAAKRG